MTTVMSFANQLKAVYPHLTKTEKKCAKYIHEHLETINNQYFVVPVFGEPEINIMVN